MIDNPNDADRILFAAFEQEFMELKQRGGNIIWEFTRFDAWCLMATIQLACRHPEFKGITRAYAESFGRSIQKLLEEDSEALAIVAERGWHPAYDEK